MSESQKACQTPLTDLLKNVPKDARMLYEHSKTCHQNIPFGRLCAEALAEIERLQAEAERYRAALESIAFRLRKAGANLPAPENKGTAESSIIAGLSIALLLVEEALTASGKERR